MDIKGSIVWKRGQGSVGSECGPVVSYSEEIYEPSGLIKCREFFRQMSVYHLLDKDYTPLS